ncbi:MAG: redoxin domain-containing protein [Planctomycetota bacterium]
MKTSLLSLALVVAALPLRAQDGDPAKEGEIRQEPAKKQGEGQEPKKEEKKTYEAPWTVGKEVDPKTTLTDIFGKKLSFSELQGKVVFVHFWSRTCPYEKVAEPKINQISADYAKKGVVVIGINANGNELGPRPDAKAFETEDEAKRPYADLRAHYAKNEVNHRILADHDNVVADKFAARSTPHCFVIDAKGVVRYDGALDDDPRGSKEDGERSDYVRLAIDAVLAGKAPEETNTKPYG